MFKTLQNAFKIPELRNKILFTIFIIVIYRFGAVIPVPFIDSAQMYNQLAYYGQGSIFQYMNILSGDAFGKATLFALSITPYITASIVMQLLTIAIPALEKLQKSGEDGQKKINRITRYVTVGLGLVTSIGYYFLMKNSYNALTSDGETFLGACTIIACYCAGTAMIMWLAEKINDDGIGNGISLILFANIVSSGPALVNSLYSSIKGGIEEIVRGSAADTVFAEGETASSVIWGGIGNVFFAVFAVVFALAAITFVIFVTESERRIPIQYAKKVVGRKMYGGQSTNLPLKLNMAGVMPIIFASSIVSIPATIIQFLGTPEEGSFLKTLSNLFSTTSVLYVVLFFILIIAFSYFYIAISFNPIEVSNNLRKNGGFIPGIRPGKPTSDYITKILNRVTLMGAFFLSMVSVLPMIINIISGGQLGSIAFSGSSLLIVVGVALETAREIEAQMSMRHYKGFLE